LRMLHHWSITWQMNFNPFKCEFLRITNKRNPIFYQYSINDSAIQQVPHAKYLGVIIDEKLSWNEHMVTNKARQAIAFLRHHILKCPAHVKCNIYKIMVRPILEYGSTIWDPHTNLNKDTTHSLVQRLTLTNLNFFHL